MCRAFGMRLARSSPAEGQIILSPALWVAPSEVRAYQDDVYPVQIFLHVGTIGDITDDARLMRDVLEQQGYEYMYMETNEGHSWGNWNGIFDEMLAYFFPPVD